MPERKDDLPRVKEEVNEQRQTPTFSLGLPITLTSFCRLKKKNMRLRVKFYLGQYEDCILGNGT